MVAVIDVNLLFYNLLKALDRLEDRVMYDIEMFRCHLTVGEKGRMNFQNPPGVPLEIFDRYLPFAIALDVESKWGKQFDPSLNRLGGFRVAVSLVDSPAAAVRLVTQGRHWVLALPLRLPILRRKLTGLLRQTRG